MAQYKTGSVSVTNGSQTVTGLGTLWSSEVSSGDIFTVVGENAWYEVGSVDSDTQITLSASYAGVSASGAAYAITRDFTTNYGWPYPQKGDIETASLIKRAFEDIDAKLVLTNTDGDVTVAGDITLSAGTANGVAYLNGSKVLTSGSALTFDGTTLATTGALTVSGNTILGDASTDTVTVNGYMGVGGAASSSYGINLTPSALTGTTQRGLSSSIIGTSAATSSITGVRGSVETAAASFTVSDAIALLAAGGGKGAGSTITNQHGVYVADQTYGTNNYGITSLVSSGTNKWNIYASGTAANYFAGNVGIGTTNYSAQFSVGIGSNSAALDYLNPSGTVVSTVTGPSSTDTVHVFGQSGYATSGAANAYLVLRPNHGNTGYGAGYYFQSYRTQSAFANDDYLAIGRLVRSASGAATTTERARIDSSGNLLVGTTSIFGDGISAMIRGSAGGTTSYFYFNRANTTSGGTVLAFANAGTVVGSVTHTSTSTTYATSSDYRLKNTIAPMTGALAKVAALKPVTYKWNADGSDGEGFIAHELAEVCPQAVTGEKDAVDADGNPVYQGIDTSFLVATLTAAIQEQQAIIEDLKSRLTAAGL